MIDQTAELVVAEIRDALALDGDADIGAHVRAMREALRDTHRRLVEARETVTRMAFEIDALKKDAPELLAMLETLCGGIEWMAAQRRAILSEGDKTALAAARALIVSVREQEPPE